MKIIKPEITINSFEEQDVKKYIDMLDSIAMSYPAEQAILINIDSFGGCVYGLGALYDFIKSIPNTIITYTSSKAFSAGAILLSTAGTKGYRMASQNAVIMVHRMQVGLPDGDIDESTSKVLHFQRTNNNWMEILAKSMGLQSAEDINKLLTKNATQTLYLTAQQALKLDIIDDVACIRSFPFSGWEFTKVASEPSVQEKSTTKRKKVVDKKK
jgi:ATP-dependent protease ClpP protease subunit